MDYQEQLRRWEARRVLAAKLRAAGHSFAEVGRRLKPAASAQAVHKMLKKTARK